MAIQESGEMYLETILVLSKKLGNVRSLDVAEELGYSKPSVSRAVGLLKSGNYIVMEEDGHIALCSLVLLTGVLHAQDGHMHVAQRAAQLRCHVG